MPWEKVSLYMDDEPDFNDTRNPQLVVREPVLKIKEQDEKEIADLLEDVKDRFDFYKKHTDINYDQEFKYLKVDPQRLNQLEIDKVTAQFDSKAAG